MSESAAALHLRAASTADIPALLALEDASFTTDRLAARNFRHLLRCGNCALLVAVAEKHGQPVLAGYVLLLFRGRSATARIYSIAVDARFRGMGIGDLLLGAAETAARQHPVAAIRLEVRPDNTAAIRLYGKHGYQCFAEYPGFYEDGSDALRFEKRL